MIKIFFPGLIKNNYRYQGILLAISDEYKKYKSIHINRLYSRNDINILIYIGYRIIFLCKQVFAIFVSDVVFFCNMGIDYRLFKIAVFLRKRIIVDFYISRYQTSVLSRKTIPIGSKLAIKLLHEEMEIVEKSTVLIFLNNTERDFYLSFTKGIPQSSTIIPLITCDYNKKAALNYWHNGKKLCFCWWGGELNPIHGLGNIIKGLKIIEEQGIQFDFFIFGYDESYGNTYYNKLLSEVGWEKKIFPRYDLTIQNGGLIDFLVENCDLAFGPLSLEPKAKSVITNKALDSINLGIPLVTIESPAMREYFDDDSVWYCKDDSVELIAEKVLTIINSSRFIINDKVNKANNILKQTFMLESQKNKIYDLIDGLFT